MTPDEAATVAATTAKLTGEITPGLRFRHWDGRGVYVVVRPAPSVPNWWVVQNAYNVAPASVESTAVILKNLV